MSSKNKEMATMHGRFSALSNDKSHGEGLNQGQSKLSLAASNIAQGLKRATAVAPRGEHLVSVSGTEAADDVRACLYMRVGFVGSCVCLCLCLWICAPMCVACLLVECLHVCLCFRAC